MKKDNCVVRFFTLIGADFYKMFRSKSFYIIFGVLAGYILLDIGFTALANYMLKEILLIEDGSICANPLFADSLSYGNLGLFLVIFFAVFLCSEFRTNTIRYKVSTGYSRICVYFASLAFTYAVALFGVALCCIINAAVGIPVLGWRHTTADMQNALYAFFALLPFLAVVHTLAYSTKSLGITLGVGLPVVIILPGILGIISLFTQYSAGVEWFTRIVFVALQQYIPQALQAGSEVFPYLALNASLCYILWTALFIAIGCLCFIKQDIK